MSKRGVVSEARGAWGRAYKQQEWEDRGVGSAWLFWCFLPGCWEGDPSEADGGSMLGCMLVWLVPALVVWGTAFCEVMVTTRQGELVAMWLGQLGVIWQRVAGKDAITSEIWCPTVVACKAFQFYANVPGVYGPCSGLWWFQWLDEFRNSDCSR